MRLAKVGKLFYREFRQIQARKIAAAIASSAIPNLALFGVKDGPNIILTFAKGGHITTELLAKGHFQRDDFFLALALARSEGFPMNGCFVDVGANIGTQTIYALQSGFFSSAACFEPEPQNFRLLRANLVLNGLENLAATFQMAVSDTAGVIDFEISPENIGDHRVSIRDDNGAFNEKNRTRISVSRDRLDNLLEKAGISVNGISMLWTDTQGHEDAVLAGATGVLNNNTPVLLEFWPYALERSGGTRNFVNFLQQNFTHFYDLDERPSPRRHPIKDLNDVASRLTGIRNTDILAFRRKA
jgi:FkbM family methyltransferase